MSTNFFLMSIGFTLLMMIIILTQITRWFNSVRTSYSASFITVFVIGIITYFVSRSAYSLNSNWVYCILLLLVPYMIVLILKTDFMHALGAAFIVIITAAICLTGSAYVCSKMSSGGSSIEDCLSEIQYKFSSGLSDINTLNPLSYFNSTGSNNTTATHATGSAAGEPLTPITDYYQNSDTPLLDELQKSIQLYCTCKKSDSSCLLQYQSTTQIALEKIQSRGLSTTGQQDFNTLRQQAQQCNLTLAAYEAPNIVVWANVAKQYYPPAPIGAVAVPGQNVPLQTIPSGSPTQPAANTTTQAMPTQPAANTTTQPAPTQPAANTTTQPAPTQPAANTTTQAAPTQPAANTTTQATPNQTTTNGSIMITPAQASQYIGRRVNITLAISGLVRNGQLVSADSSNITLQINYTSGTIRSQIPTNIIQQIEVLPQ